jgi:hypothetical protein
VSGSAVAAARCLSMGDYVTGMGATRGRPLPEGASVAYAPGAGWDYSENYPSAGRIIAGREVLRGLGG